MTPLDCGGVDPNFDAEPKTEVLFGGAPKVLPPKGDGFGVLVVWLDLGVNEPNFGTEVDDCVGGKDWVPNPFVGGVLAGAPNVEAPFAVDGKGEAEGFANGFEFVVEAFFEANDGAPNADVPGLPN